MIELSRYLLNMDVTDDSSKAPVKIFLSHAKVDMESEPKIAKRFIEFLRADQPVEAWVDSGDIDTGSNFVQAIEKGIRQSSVLALLTDNYSTREFCREEIMLAKEMQRPIAVIDALMTHEIRSFPFLENDPRMRWNGDCQPAIDLIMKETLRQLHTELLLEDLKQPSDVIFLRPPEPATLLGVAPGTNILYRDPPLGVGEQKRLLKAGVTFSTPLQRAATDCALKGKTIALSMSESTDIARWGLDEPHLQSAIMDLSPVSAAEGCHTRLWRVSGIAELYAKVD